MIRPSSFSSAGDLLSSALAYLVITIATGYIQARLAKRWGDDTAYQAGFLSLNPLVYVDFFGFLFFILYGFGWGAPVPIDSNRFDVRYRTWETVFSYAIRPLATLVCAFISLQILVAFLGGFLLPVSIPGFFVQHTALLYALQLIFKKMTIYGFWFTAFILVRDLFMWLLQLAFARFGMIETELVALVCAVVLIYYFSAPLAYVVYQGVVVIELFLWQWWVAVTSLMGIASWYVMP